MGGVGEGLGDGLAPGLASPAGAGVVPVSGGAVGTAGVVGPVTGCCGTAGVGAGCAGVDCAGNAACVDKSSPKTASAIAPRKRIHGLVAAARNWPRVSCMEGFIGSTAKRAGLWHDALSSYWIGAASTRYRMPALMVLLSTSIGLTVRQPAWDACPLRSWNGLGSAAAARFEVSRARMKLRMQHASLKLPGAKTLRSRFRPACTFSPRRSSTQVRQFFVERRRAAYRLLLSFFKSPRTRRSFRFKRGTSGARGPRRRSRVDLPSTLSSTCSTG